MATSAKEAGIVQFAGDGYDSWKFRVEIYLDDYGVREAIEKDPPEATAADGEILAFKARDAKAKALLVAFIADSHLEYVRDKPTAKAMWTSLANTFAKTGFAAQNHFRRSLALLRMDDRTALQDHFRKFDGLIRQLKDAGAVVTELNQVCYLFISLPASYDVVNTALEKLPAAEIKLGIVKACLLKEEQRRNGTGRR